MRNTKRFRAGSRFANQLTHWVNEHDFGVCFRGSGWGEHFGMAFEAMAAVGIKERFRGDFIKDREFLERTGDFTIVHLSYDVKNKLEGLHSENPDRVGFAEAGFTVPDIVVIADKGMAEFQWSGHVYDEVYIDALFEHISRIEEDSVKTRFAAVQPQAAMSREEYMQRFHRLQTHIQRGDVYQANLCQEFYWEGADFKPAALFNSAFTGMPNPFSVFYKFDGKYSLGLSPERFLSFSGDTVLSQPMKGTAPRSADPVLDEVNKEKLRQSEKDRRENVMIVDMVRHDLSHFARQASVKVPELYKIRTYPKVHQMYSTITAEVREGAGMADVLLNAFPMGSMTGAPKVRAMQLIEELELSKRGLFSGTIGFVTPAGNADFNVVIRSLLYDPATKYLSCQVGGGITAMSDAVSEYEECLLKFEPIRRLIEEVCQAVPQTTFTS